MQVFFFIYSWLPCSLLLVSISTRSQGFRMPLSSLKSLAGGLAMGEKRFLCSIPLKSRNAKKESKRERGIIQNTQTDKRSIHKVTVGLSIIQSLIMVSLQRTA